MNPFHSRKLTIAFGPEMPGWGSWHWVGEDLARQLDGPFQTTTFRYDQTPQADAVVVVKHPPPPDFVRRLPSHVPVVFCPIDFYGAAAEIDADSRFLRRCARVVLHCEKLRRYFEPYAPVAYLDHHVRFAAPSRLQFRPDGFFLWVGVRTNLPPLVEFVNDNPLPGELRVLSNFERPDDATPMRMGFRPGSAVRLAEWSPALHSRWTSECRAALDVKGGDFRSRHKPPAKAIDFLASGVPLALDPDGSAADHLARLGLEVPPPVDLRRWLSPEYWDDVRRFGGAVRELLSLPRVAGRLGRILREVVAEHS